MNYRTSEKALAIKLLLACFYIALYFLLFFLITENYAIFFSTLVVTVVSLWHGPLALIGSNGKRHLLDPATIFNSAMFYFTIKGIPLAWGEAPSEFRLLAWRFGFEDYPLVALYVLFGLISWNWAYRMVLNPFWRTSDHIPGGRVASVDDPVTNLGFGAFALSIVATISFVILFWTIKRDVFVFLTEPVQRAYLADAVHGAGLSSGYFLLYGIFMLPIASIMWLADLGRRKRRISLAWCVHALVCIVVLLLVSPRSNLISYAISVLIIYSLLFGKLGFLTVGVSSLCILLYAALTTIWRGIVGSMQTPTFVAGISALTETADLGRQLVGFFSTQGLADIRIFLVVENFYGKVVPLEYGSTLARLVTQLIPRALWPDKPYDLGNEIGRLIDPNTVSGTPPGFFAEMYMNFHVVGVIFGGLFLGALMAMLYRAWILSHPSTLSIVLYSILAPRIFLIPSSTIANFTISLLIFYSAVLLLSKTIPKLASKESSSPKQVSTLGGIHESST